MVSTFFVRHAFPVPGRKRKEIAAGLRRDKDNESGIAKNRG